MIRYPLSEFEKSKIRSKTGKTLDDITLDNVLKGKISSEDIKISKEVLLMQGEVAENDSKPQMKQNFQRASEMVDIPDELLLRIYNMLRPNRSTKAELLSISELLVKEYSAHKCAAMVLEAADIYEKRGVLL